MYRGNVSTVGQVTAIPIIGGQRTSAGHRELAVTSYPTGIGVALVAPVKTAGYQAIHE
jgi:hypothetical protein